MTALLEVPGEMFYIAMTESLDDEGVVGSPRWFRLVWFWFWYDAPLTSPPCLTLSKTIIFFLWTAEIDRVLKKVDEGVELLKKSKYWLCFVIATVNENFVAFSF
jgi:hypothetical protein